MNPKTSLETFRELALGYYTLRLCGIIRPASFSLGPLVTFRWLGYALCFRNLGLITTYQFRPVTFRLLVTSRDLQVIRLCAALSELEFHK